MRSASAFSRTAAARSPATCWARAFSCRRRPARHFPEQTVCRRRSQTKRQERTVRTPPGCLGGLVEGGSIAPLGRPPLSGTGRGHPYR
jgi:hypothetical protein